MLSHNHFTELYKQFFNNLLECVSGDLLRYRNMFQLGFILCSNFQFGVFINKLKSDKKHMVDFTLIYIFPKSMEILANKTSRS